MTDVKVLLEELSEESESGKLPTAAPAKKLRWPWVGAAAMLVVAAAGIGLWLSRGREEPSPHVVRFQISAPEKVQFPEQFRLTLSPDGRRIVFPAQDAAEKVSLWVRSLDSLQARPLPGTENPAGVPFWSPDSRWIGFMSEGKLKKIEVSGGPPQTLCKAPGDRLFGAWNREGVILFGSNAGLAGLFRVSQAGGDPVQVTTIDRSQQELAHTSPHFLPDGRHFIYFAYAHRQSNSVYLATFDRKERKLLVKTRYSAVYAPPASAQENGHLLFLREGGALMAQPLDARTYDLAGEPVPVADQVGAHFNYGLFSASANGVLAYRSGASVATNTELMWFDRAGQPLGRLGPPGDYNDLALSADGRRAAVTARDPQSGNRDSLPGDNFALLHFAEPDGACARTT
jgi:hypothetical protein